MIIGFSLSFIRLKMQSSKDSLHLIIRWVLFLKSQSITLRSSTLSLETDTTLKVVALLASVIMTKSKTQIEIKIFLCDANCWCYYSWYQKMGYASYSYVPNDVLRTSRQQHCCQPMQKLELQTLLRNEKEVGFGWCYSRVIITKTEKEEEDDKYLVIFSSYFKSLLS